MAMEKELNTDGTINKNSKEVIRAKEKEGKINKKQIREREIAKWKIGTWNIWGINGKEIEIIDEFEQTELDILVISETKKKGQGKTNMKNEHILIYSGVQQKQKAAAGVRCILHKRLTQNIIKWEAVTERILKVQIETEKREIISMIGVYGPDENEKVEQKEKFWEDLGLLTEEAKGTIYIASDFNGRVGKSSKTKIRALGKYGEEMKNNNGERLLEYYHLYDLIITNTFYQHKDIHKSIRVQHTRQEKSIIDYILVQRSKRRNIKDVRVRRGAEIYSDHYLLIAEIRERLPIVEKPITRKYQSIRAYKLRNKNIVNKYRQLINDNFNKNQWEIKKRNLEEK